uniref:Butyrophilin subfamily 2 member A2 n=1 Tax=Monodelphis domestica TaxID=13616 RepID=A0A5F8G884_MONDO
MPCLRAPKLSPNTPAPKIMNMAYFPDHSVLSGLVAVLFLQLLTMISAQFTVVAPAKPLLVMVGEDAILHCHLFPKKNAEQMEVRWFRSQFSPAIYVYKDGKNRDEEQMEEYRSRTTFMRDNIKDGSVALKIHNVTAFENGRYHCYFQEGRSYDEAFIDLKVARRSWLRANGPKSESPRRNLVGDWGSEEFTIQREIHKKPIQEGVCVLREWFWEVEVKN